MVELLKELADKLSAMTPEELGAAIQEIHVEHPERFAELERWIIFEPADTREASDGDEK